MSDAPRINYDRLAPPISQREHDVMISLRVLMIDARNRLNLSQKDWAERLGFTPQYVCDLEQGRRLGSVEFVDRACDHLGLSDKKRKEWHRAGARAHGWNV